MVEIFSEGQNTDAVRLGGLIVRRALHFEAGSSLRREAIVLPHLRSLLPLMIPESRIVELHGEVLSLHPAISEEPLRSVKSLTEALASSVAEELGGFLYALHKDSTGAAIGRLASDIPKADSNWWRSFASDVETRVAPELSISQRDAVRLAFEEHQRRMQILPLALIHGDFGIGDILWDGSKITGIIDFGSMRWADPAWDVAGIAAGFGIDFARKLTNGYPQSEDLLERASFYRLAFALMEANYGARHKNREIFRAGIDGVACALSTS